MNYKPLAAQVAKELGLPPTLIESWILQESSGRAYAYRYEPGYYRLYIMGKPEWSDLDKERVAASYGLLQIMYPTARQHGFKGYPEELFVPETNVKIACKILGNLLEWSKGDIRKALAAYNGGKGNWSAERPQKYAEEVLARQAKLEAK